MSLIDDRGTIRPHGLACVGAIGQRRRPVAFGSRKDGHARFAEMWPEVLQRPWRRPGLLPPAIRRSRGLIAHRRRWLRLDQLRLGVAVTGVPRAVARGSGWQVFAQLMPSALASGWIIHSISRQSDCTAETATNVLHSHLYLHLKRPRRRARAHLPVRCQGRAGCSWPSSSSS